MTNNRGKYYSYYDSRSKKLIRINRVKLESGMICQILYRSKDKITKRLNPAKLYYVLILHPSYFSNNKYRTHCLRLDNIQPNYFEKLIEDVGLVESKTVLKIKKFKLDQLLLYENKAKMFYLSKLKANMKLKYENSYREFNYLQIADVKVIDFLFHKPKILLEKKTNQSISNIELSLFIFKNIF